MDNEKLREIRDRIAMLPDLEERLDKLRALLNEAEENVRAMEEKYKNESLDVERLKKNSLSSLLLKIWGGYEGRLDRETEEMLRAKLEYDKACERAEELRQRVDELTERITAIREEQLPYEEELKKREQVMLRDITGETAIRYRALEAERRDLLKQTIGIDEALLAANRAKETAKQVKAYLGSAEDWATLDMWLRGGLVSYAAKYKNVDAAQKEFNKLSSQMEDLKKELKDINIENLPQIGGIDSGTRAVDFWFDNMLTDNYVRENIRHDADQVLRLAGIINELITNLENKKQLLQDRIEAIEAQKKDLLILG